MEKRAKEEEEEEEEGEEEEAEENKVRGGGGKEVSDNRFTHTYTNACTHAGHTTTNAVVPVR